MYPVSVIKPFRNCQPNFPNDFFRYCNNGNVKQAKMEIAKNVNIYQTFTDMKLTSMLFALHSKKEPLVNHLLDIYERDLSVLSETNFKRALIATETDLNNDFYACCVDEFPCEADVEPVLIKINNHEAPKCLYLRKQLKSKDDLCLKIIGRLEEENGTCDLNWRFKWALNEDDNNHYGDCYLYLAAYFGMTSVLKRLLSNRTVDRKTDKQEHDSIHFAICSGKVDSIKALLAEIAVRSFDSYLWQAASSGSSESFECIVAEIKKCGNCTLKEILATKLNEPIYNLPLHLIAASENCEYFLNHKLPIEEDDVIAQNGDGDTILHILARKFDFNEHAKTFLNVARKFPKMLAKANDKHFLPVHQLAMNVFEDVELLDVIFRITVAEMKDENAIFSNMEIALTFLEKLIEVTNWKSLKFLVENANYDVAKEHGNRLLHCAIRNCQSNYKCFEYLLSHPSKIDPNIFYDGSNAFLTAASGSNWNFSVNAAQHLMEVLTKDYNIEDINAVDAHGNSILMFVVSFAPDIKLIKFLIDLGADCKRLNNDSCTTMHFAARNRNNEDVYQFLVDQGVDPEVSDANGETAISQAARYGNEIAFKFLLQFQSDYDLNRRYGEAQETLLHITARAYNSDNFELLIKKNPDSAARDVYGKLFIHKLVVRQDSFLEKLHRKNIPIDVNACDNSGNSVLSLAAAAGCDVELEFLLENYWSQIDFSIVNDKLQTFTHQMCYDNNILRYERLFVNFPSLTSVMNRQMSSRDIDESTPLDYMIQSPHLMIDSETRRFLIRYLDLQNFQRHFNKFIKDFEMIEMITEKFPTFFNDFSRLDEIVEIVMRSTNDRRIFNHLLQKTLRTSLLADWRRPKNVLHLICERNDANLIDSLLKLLSCHQLNSLARQLDGSENVAKSYLNQENKIIFANCF